MNWRVETDLTSAKRQFAGKNFAEGFDCAAVVSGFAAASIIGDRQPAQVNP